MAVLNKSLRAHGGTEGTEERGRGRNSHKDTKTLKKAKEGPQNDTGEVRKKRVTAKKVRA